MQTRYKCTLKPGVRFARAEGTASDGYVYLYGDGPWGDLREEDLQTRESCPLESQPSTVEGRDAPAR